MGFDQFEYKSPDWHDELKKAEEKVKECVQIILEQKKYIAKLEEKLDGLL